MMMKLDAKTLSHHFLENGGLASFHQRIQALYDIFYQKSYEGTTGFVFAGKDICILGLDFTFNKDIFRYQLLERDYTMIELLCVGNSILSSLHAINRFGFITEAALPCGYMALIMEHLTSMGYRKQLMGNSEICYTMWYNLVFVNMYYLIEKVLKAHEDDVVREGDFFLVHLGVSCYDEVVADLQVMKEAFKSRLEQYLKVQIQRRGITLIENTYTGFDTEYQLEDLKKFKNKLISIQTAVQRRTILKMPLYHPYDISYVDPLSSSISDTYKSKVNSNNSYKYKFVESVDLGPESRSQKRTKFKELELLNNSLLFTT
jgi:hypothetical protein